MRTSDFTGSVIGGQFEALKRLGGGHFGDVYLCHNRLVGRNSAVKIIPVDNKDRDAAAVEAKLLSLSSHNHIVKVQSASYWTKSENEIYFLIEMENIEGGNLQDAINDGISIGRTISTIKNVLFALQHAHLEIIHRDVKPANILLGRGGILTDFGIAMLVSTGERASTLQYSFNLAPECYPPSALFDEKTDIFATGLTLFRAMNLISDWPAEVRAVNHWQSKMRSGTLIPSIGFHPRTPMQVKKIINRACNSNRTKRYLSASDFRDALESVRIIRDWTQIDPLNWQCHFNNE